MPITIIKIKKSNNLGFTAFLNIIKDGKDKAVTLIIKDNIVPSPAPLVNNASAIGKVPKISAYIGIPIIVARGTPYQLLAPSKFSIHDSGMTLWMIHPIPTPMTMNQNTFL